MDNNIGALWLKESKKGNKFMSGVVELGGEKYNIVVFKNTYKEKENHPDYRIFESKPRAEQPAAGDDLQEGIPF